MSNKDTLEEIREIIEDRRMKSTGKLDAISEVLEEAGYASDEGGGDEEAYEEGYGEENE